VCAGCFAKCCPVSYFEVKPTDTITFASVALLFGGIALSDVTSPADGPCAVDPMAALRHEWMRRSSWESRGPRRGKYEVVESASLVRNATLRRSRMEKRNYFPCAGKKRRSGAEKIGSENYKGSRSWGSGFPLRWFAIAAATTSRPRGQAGNQRNFAFRLDARHLRQFFFSRRFRGCLPRMDPAVQTCERK